MKRAEIDKILNELFFEFNDKATALLDARKVFVNFDPEVQLSILQLNQHSDLNAVLPELQKETDKDPLYLTLCNIYWIKVYNQIVSKSNYRLEVKTMFYTKYCTQNGKVFGLNAARKALSVMNDLSNNSSLIDVLANQVGIYDTIWSFKFVEKSPKTRIHGTGINKKRKIDQCFNMVRTFEQIAKTINLSISADESLLEIDEKNFDKAIDELTTNLNMNKGYYIRINEHLEIQLAKTAITIYVKFSEIASGKLNKLYGR
ncbi:hypothetical protein [Acinetobacter johnsonii]|uniref:hypothetical protein n=1 Tax=Acinetobacter johnsonii TaxID=40214 RepID=UPI002448E6ED|nr:hypothetical protein [Acinetobacter johnsonii]MDH1802153.1 hypothetical protein [Acinetobacter johnsonii]